MPSPKTLLTPALIALALTPSAALAEKCQDCGGDPPVENHAPTADFTYDATSASSTGPRSPPSASTR